MMETVIDPPLWQAKRSIYHNKSKEDDILALKKKFIFFKRVITNSESLEVITLISVIGTS